MPARRWIIIVALIFILSVILIWTSPFWGWQNLVNRFILYHLRPILGSNAHLQKVDLSLTSLTLYNLTYSDTTKGYEFEIPRLRLNLQIFNVVKYGFSLINLVEDTRFENWHFKINPAVSQPPADSLQKSSPSARALLWELPSKIPSLKRLYFINGSFAYHEMNLDSIYGWINLSQEDSLQFDLSAAYLNPFTNSRLQGGASLKEKDLLIMVKIENALLPSDLKLHPQLNLQKGTLNLQATSEFSTKGLAVAGEVTLEKVNFDFSDDWEVRKGNLKAEFAGHSARFYGDGKLNGQKIAWAGKIEGFAEPQIEIVCKAKNADFTALLKKIAPQMKVNGKGDLKLKLNGPASAPQLDFQANSPEISYKGIKFEKVLVTGMGEGNTIDLKDFSFQTLGGKFSNQGNLDLRDKHLKLNIKTQYSGKPNFEGLINLKQKLPIDTLNLCATIIGNLNNPQIDAIYDLHISQVDKTLRGTAKYQDQLLNLTEASGNGDSVNTIVDFRETAPLFSLDFRNPQKLLNNPAWQNIIGDNTNIILTAEGSPKDFQTQTAINFRNANIYITGHLTSYDSTKFTGNYRWTYADSIEDGGEFLLRLAQDTIKLENLTFNDKAYAWGAFDFKNLNLLNLDIRTDQFPLDNFLNHTSWEEKSSFGGDLKSAINIRGELDSLYANFNFLISKGRVFGTDGFWVSLHGEYEHGVLNLNGCDFGNREKTLFHGDGWWNTKQGQIEFKSAAQNVDAELLLNSFSEKYKGSFSGSGDYSLHASGDWNRPNIKVNFDFNKGKVFKIPYENCNGAVLLNTDDSLGLVLEIDELQLRKFEDYSAEIRGRVPLERGEIALKFRADGQLLSILPQLTRYIKRAEGNSHLEAEILSSKNTIQFRNASATLDEGVMEFNTIVDKIENLKLFATLDSNFIQIHSLTGEIAGVPFKITTLPYVNTADGPLQPWIIGNTGLSLGIITLENDSKGLRMNLAGIVKAGETANLTALGKHEGELAYIAGPEIHPVVRAKLLVRDGILDCPSFKKRAYGKRSVISKLLRKINWDLEVIPDRGNTYNRDLSGLVNTAVWKDISGFFSRAVVDLEIDRQLQGLLLRGSLDDTTFAITGKLNASNGTVDVLDMDYKIQSFSAEFTPGEIRPVVEGYATMLVRDSLGREQTVTLRVAEVDPITGEKNYRPLWGDFTFILENEIGDSPEQILSQMGYSVETLDQRVYELPVKVADKAVFGIWMGRLEREIKNVLGIDYLNIDPAVAQNLLEEQLLTPAFADSTQIDWRARYLRRSRFVVGKYLTEDIFFSYSGRFESGESPLDQRYRLGMINTWNLEYRLPAKGANLLIVLSYEYDNLEEKADRRVSVRYDFNF